MTTNSRGEVSQFDFEELANQLLSRARPPRPRIFTVACVACWRRVQSPGRGRHGRAEPGAGPRLARGVGWSRSWHCML